MDKKMRIDPTSVGAKDSKNVEIRKRLEFPEEKKEESIARSSRKRKQVPTSDPKERMEDIAGPSKPSSGTLDRVFGERKNIALSDLTDEELIATGEISDLEESDEDYVLGSGSSDESADDEDLDDQGEFADEYSFLGSNVNSASNLALPLASTQRQAPQSIPSSTWTGQKRPVSPFPFTGSPGMKVQVDEPTPFNYFKLFLTDKLVDNILEQTNLHGEKLRSETPFRRSRMADFKPISRGDFYKFLGLIFHMGVIAIADLNDYWRKDRFFNLPFFSSAMSRDKFQNILRALHFSSGAENSGNPGRLSKIRLLLTHFEETMSTIYYPNRELSIDESMILWRGRLIFRQYMKGKKHKYGIKLYSLCEKSGLVQKLSMVYTGAAEREVGERPHAQRVVDKLMHKFKGKGHSIHMDNYFTSVNIVKWLLEEKIYCTGTLRSNRKGNPEAVTKKKLKKGEVVQRFSKEGICVLKWRDKRDFLLISSEYDGELKTFTNKRGKEVEKPGAVWKYNEFMGGTDRLDQLLSYNLTPRKTIRWYKILSIHILQIMLMNSLNLYKQYSNSTKFNLKQFRLNIIGNLVDEGEKMNRAFDFPLAVPALPSGKPKHLHFPEFMPFRDGEKGQRRKQKDCRICTGKKIRRPVSIYCPDCEDHPSLCLCCFKEYHGRKD